MTPQPDASTATWLRDVDERPSPATYAQAARAVQGLALEPVRVALLASFTIEPIVPYVTVEAARRGFVADSYIAPFNSIVPELVTPTSGCVQHRPDVVFVAYLLEDLCPPLARDFLALEPAQVAEYIEHAASELHASLNAFRRVSAATVMVHNVDMPLYPALGLVDGVTGGSQTAAIRGLNAAFVDVAASIADVHVLDYERLVAETGSRQWYDSKMWYLGRAPLSSRAMVALAHHYATVIGMTRRPARKCLVLDLDDTLWGGVIGEAGATGIKLGTGYPGAVFSDFQRLVRQLKHRGVLLALNSKNNLDDVREAFTDNPDMILTLDDFAAVRVNWNQKPANMVEIAEQLNIGLDSLVFVDDNPTERELMRQALPQVLTLELPPNPLKYAEILLESRAFERLAFTGEDRRRTEMYKEQAARRQLEASVLSLDDFLASLQMQIAIEPVNEKTLQRTADLIHKTNQFNLTTRRHSPARLAEMLADPSVGMFTMRVTDRFGDNGIVGVAIILEQDGLAEIDTLLLSCRVIGRTVETALLAYLLEWTRARGLDRVEGEFIPTAKNAPAADFYARHAFAAVARDGDRMRWAVQLDAAAIESPAYIAVLA